RLASLLQLAGYFAGAAAPPVRRTHHAAKAKHVIFLFMNGAPSHVDTFDPKPMLDKFDGKPYVDKSVPTVVSNNRPVGHLMKSPFPFKKHGQSGLPISSLFPNSAKFAD